MFPEELVHTVRDLGLEPTFLSLLGRIGTLDVFLPAYRKVVSRAIHPDLQDSKETSRNCEARLKRFNSAFETVNSAKLDVAGWFSLPAESRESVLLDELRRRNRELQQLREELACEQRANTRRWNISAL